MDVPSAAQACAFQKWGLQNTVRHAEKEIARLTQPNKVAQQKKKSDSRGEYEQACLRRTLWRRRFSRAKAEDKLTSRDLTPTPAR
jgi:hypothetical protein